MTIEDKIAYLWNAAYERALGCSHKALDGVEVVQIAAPALAA